MFNRARRALPSHACRLWPRATAVFGFLILGCSTSGSSQNDAGTQNGTPTVASLSPSTQSQTIPIASSSGPVSGSITLPAIHAGATDGGTLTLTVQSGPNVALTLATSGGKPAADLQQSGNGGLPGGSYIFEFSLSAPFPFELVVPAFDLNLGPLGQSLPNGSYTLVAVIGSGPPYEFPITAQNDVLTFPGVDDPLLVPAGTTLLFGVTASSGLPPPTAGPPAVFVVDSTSTLYAFDANGNVRQKVSLPGTVGNLNGGEIALANGNVYVTLGQPTNQVVAYTQAGLQPVALPSGAFSGLFVPRGLTYDTHSNVFYVGNGGAGVNAFDQSGTSIATPGGFPGRYGPSGVAYDSDHNTIWVANYFGSPGGTTTYGTAEYNEDGSATQSFNLSQQFVSPLPHEQPYSVAYCPVTKGCRVFNVWIGFIDDGSGQGTGALGVYQLDGGFIFGLSGPLAPGEPGAIIKPYQLTFDSQGFTWIADEGGLIQYTIELGYTDNFVPRAFTAAVTPPIYGVGAL